MGKVRVDIEAEYHSNQGGYVAVAMHDGDAGMFMSRSVNASISIACKEALEKLFHDVQRDHDEFIERQRRSICHECE